MIRTAILLSITLVSTCLNLSFAQTNVWVPATKLEAFETNLNVVILKSSTELGSFSTDAANVTVRCREISDTSTGHKEQGLAIEVAQRLPARTTFLIDYEEIASVIKALDYLNKLDVSSTVFNYIDAEYTTRGGLRLSAFGARRTGNIQFGLKDARIDSPPIVFSRQQLVQFLGLLNQAKSTLDSTHTQ